MRPASKAPSLDELAAQIAWAAEARPDGDLFFVVANTHASREGFAAALRAVTPSLATLELPEEPVRFLARLREVGDAHTVLVTGLDPHGRAAGTRGSLFGGLNLDRDAIRREGRNLVFLLPAFALTALAQNAPDFYDHRTVTLEAPEEANPEGLAPLRNDLSILALNPHDRDRWIEILQAQRIAPDSTEDVERQLRLARLLYERGDFAAATEILRHVSTLGSGTKKNDAWTATILSELGSILYEQGDLDGALDAYERAECHERAKFGNDHPRVASLINSRGCVLHHRGDLDGALVLFREAERIDRTTHGSDHPSVAVDVNNIGRVLRDQGNIEGALVAYREAERIDRAAYGDDHVEVGIDVNNIGRVLERLQDLGGALDAYHKAERIFRATFGEIHPMIATVTNNIGNVLFDQGDLEDALLAYRKAETIDRTIYGDHHPSVAIRLNNIGDLLRSQGEIDDAFAHYREAFLILFRAYGPHGLNVRTAARNVAAVGGDPVALVRERFGDDAAAELEKALQEG